MHSQISVMGSQSAAKKADALFKIAFALRSSQFSASSSLSRSASSPGTAVDLGLSHPGAQRLGKDAQLLSDSADRAPQPSG